jgi:hypothetical protein
VAREPSAALGSAARGGPGDTGSPEKPSTTGEQEVGFMAAVTAAVGAARGNEPVRSTSAVPG